MILFTLILIGTIVFTVLQDTPTHIADPTPHIADQISSILIIGVLLNFFVTLGLSCMFSTNIQTYSQLYSYEKDSKEFIVGWDGENYLVRDNRDNIYVAIIKEYNTFSPHPTQTICKLEHNTRDSYLYPFLIDVNTPNDNITLPSTYKIVSVQKEIVYNPRRRNAGSKY